MPSRPVKLVIPFPAGAAADHAMRVVGQQLSTQWGRPLLIENRPGLAGVMKVVRAPADGNTLLLAANSSIVTGPLINPRLPYSPSRDLRPIGQVLTTTPVLTVHPGLGVSTMEQLLALARQKPGALNYSSSGVASPNHLAMELLQATTGTQLVHIPYKGAAISVNELMAGHVDLGINAIPSVLTHIRAGRLTAIAVASPGRDPHLPDTPTMAEAGVQGFDYEIWYGLFAPAHTPPQVLQRLSANLRQALNHPAVVHGLRAQGATPAPTTPADFAAYIARDVQRWKKIVQDRRMQLDSRHTPFNPAKSRVLQQA